MHLLAYEPGMIDGGAEAIDLGQSPGEIVFLSAADSELASLARASERLDVSLRLANLLQLQHPLSVDTYIEKTLRHARLIVLRCLGGRGYWAYGTDELVNLARETGIKIIILPGDATSDAEFSARSNLPANDVERLRQYLVAGGEENALNALRFCQHLLGQGDEPAAPAPLPKAGAYAPERWQPNGKPIAAITFYRSLLEGGLTAPVDALCEALEARGLCPLPLYVSSLKDAPSAAVIAESLNANPPDVILNATGFAVAAFTGAEGVNPFTPFDCPVLQVVFSGGTEAQWRASAQGLPARDLAMNVVLPELDGRIFTRAVSFKSASLKHTKTECHIMGYEPVADRIHFVADLAANWVKLRRTPEAERRIALVLANYPNKDGRIGNGVGFDTPASSVNIMKALLDSGYALQGIPSNGNTLLDDLLAGPTNSAASANHAADSKLELAKYLKHFRTLPETVQREVEARWGTPEKDPFFRDGAFNLPAKTYGNVAACIQPARGYNIDPKTSYHDPALVPPHGYFAFYIWLRENFGAHAIIHNGKHGNLEWLPGKATGLSAECFPEAVLGAMPQAYPFIVNDPGEGTQAKRRTSAVIIDHLTPPLTRAESYGPLRQLEALVDEYYQAQSGDPRRAKVLAENIRELAQSTRLDADAGITNDDTPQALQKLDAWLCDLKEAQIRDGLHILGETPQGTLKRDLLIALTRLPRGAGEGGDASLIRALSTDFGFIDFDPLNCDMATSWTQGKPAALEAQDPWRTNGDTVERLELHAMRLLEGHPAPGPTSSAVLAQIRAEIEPNLDACGPDEMGNLLRALAGRFVPPGPSGAPTRGRLDVLPTGRNFFSVDNRTIPTPTAWNLGERSAQELLTRHLQDHGNHLTAVGLSAWGTANMRTGGDDIAQAMALIGVRPIWEAASWRVTGFEIIPLAKLARPRVDVTLRISGFFRDAFPQQIELYDKAIRAVGALDEAPQDNPIAARMKIEAQEMTAAGVDAKQAALLAGQRIFGSKPGAYGAGLQAMIDEKLWAERGDLAKAYITWGSYAYGASGEGRFDAESFTKRLSRIEAVLHNQDNREHDLLDSDDYYQFEGGMTAAAEHASGTLPKVYHNDHSRPERPVIRTLEEEISRVVRSRAVNPKWIEGVKRHGYKGAFEIAATVDYLFAFAASTGAAKSHHFDLAYDAYLGDEATRAFLEQNNPAALKEIAERFAEAVARGLWTPRLNSAHDALQSLLKGQRP
jgi:cobaltochelatase CobN